jgi:hypothetical protein
MSNEKEKAEELVQQSKDAFRRTVNKAEYESARNVAEIRHRAQQGFQRLDEQAQVASDQAEQRARQTKKVAAGRATELSPLDRQIEEKAELTRTERPRTPRL